MLGWVDTFPPLNLWNWSSFYQGEIMHPLVGNLSEMSTEDLHKKYNELMSKMNQAYRFGPTSIIPQMQMVIESYNVEYQKRMDEMYKKQNIEGSINISSDNPRQ
jgi:hypothetical protein